MYQPLVVVTTLVAFVAAHPFRLAILRFSEHNCPLEAALDPFPDEHTKGLAWDEDVCGNGKPFVAYTPIWDLHYDPQETNITAYGDCSVNIFHDSDCQNWMGTQYSICSLLMRAS